MRIYNKENNNMKNQEQINFEQKCKNTFIEKQCVLNQDYEIEFVYDSYTSNNKNINLVNKLDNHKSFLLNYSLSISFFNYFNL